MKEQKPNHIDKVLCVMEKRVNSIIDCMRNYGYHHNREMLRTTAYVLDEHLRDQDFHPPLTDALRHYMEYKKAREEIIWAMSLLCEENI